MSAIHIEQVVVKRGSQRVLDEVNLTVNTGDRIALVGPNGSGKTTLLRVMLGLLPVTAGRVLLGGLQASRLSPLERARRLAWLPQQALAEEDITALDFVMAARFRFRESRSAAREAAQRALIRIGAADWADRLVTRLSGGEQQRVALAALLAQQSEVLLADEPANHLDPAQQVVVWSLLGQIAASGTMVVVTHDINWVHWLGELAATRVVGLKQGKLLFDVPADDAQLPERLSELYEIQVDVFEAHGRRVLIPGEGSRATP
jgi:iron complex transport system ATP-binding protein